MHDIYFRRARKVIVRHNLFTEQINFPAVAALDANLRTLGYAMDAELANALMHVLVGNIADIGGRLIDSARAEKGVREYRPKYPNFPRQVMEADAAELYINAIMHYFGAAVGLRIMPKYGKLERPKLDFDNHIVIGRGDVSNFIEVMQHVALSKVGFSDQDKDDIRALPVDILNEVFKIDTPPNRENKAFMFALAHERKVGAHWSFETATDVLRLAVALSGGDTSLATKTKFKSFNRRERRMLTNILKTIDNPVEDMLRHAGMWKRLGEKLHPGEYGLHGLFQHVREHSDVKTFNAKVEQYIADGDFKSAVDLLVHRPGEFARRIVHMLSLSKSPDFILDRFEGVVERVSPTVLLQLHGRVQGYGLRVAFPKGLAKMKVLPVKPVGFDNQWKLFVMIENALVAQFKYREGLGKVFIDPAIMNIAIPFSQRDASKSLKTLARGSRLAVDEDIVRMFLWWRDGTYRTDIDLSVAFYDENYRHVDTVSYYNLRTTGSTHSGDITSAPNGASEFVDLSIPTLVKRNIAYAVMTLHSYSAQPFSELPECFAGFMVRKNMDDGEIYDPRTVENRIDLTAESRGATPIIFDLRRRQMVWVDLPMQIDGSGGNVANTSGKITTVVEAMTRYYPPTFGVLVAAHTQARGTFTTDIDSADTVFALNPVEGKRTITPFDTATVQSELL